MEPLGVLLIVAVGYLLLRRPLRKRSRRQRRTATISRKANGTGGDNVCKLPSGRRRTGKISGKAYVTDGDGVRVCGQEVRFAGLDAPEWNQVAKHRDGYWFGHGKRVKSALIRKIGGKDIHVSIESHDKFGRAVGIVTCNGEDVGEWLVREGHARALYSDRYKHVEREARNARRGIWSHAVNIDPRSWRRRNSSRT